MKLYFPDPRKNKNLPAQLRQAGYYFVRWVQEKKGEFIKRFPGAEFPRWHLYAKEQPDGWDLNLHLDQKRPIYKGTAAHSGEYEGELVEKEIARLQQLLK
jgi:hypothetical protein